MFKQWRSGLGRACRALAYWAYLGAAVLLLLELAYRFQVIDFYRAELTAFNPPAEGSSQNTKTVLIFGDSFTAHFQSWEDQMREALPGYRLVNSAVTGTSIVEVSHIAPGRIRAFKPDILVYQIYAGNDLLGIRHELNWREWSLARNAYWLVSDRIHFAAFVNYRLGQLAWRSASGIAGNSSDATPAPDETFNLSQYNPSERIYAQGDPFLISNSVLLRNGRDRDMDYLLSSLTRVLTRLSPECKVYLLVIPHKAQVNQMYLDQMRSVGFHFEEKFRPGEEDYPFIARIKAHFAPDRRVEIINPLPDLTRSDAAGARTYFLNDEHLTRAGQAVVRDVVMNRLAARSD